MKSSKVICKALTPVMKPEKEEKMKRLIIQSCALVTILGLTLVCACGAENSRSTEEAAIAGGLAIASPLEAPKIWKQVSVGNYHACAIGIDQSLWCWGSNIYGQVGSDTVSRNGSESRPLQIGAETSWKSVSAGSYHSCAIKTNKTLWCWGYNANGQIGLGYSGLPEGAPLQVGTAKTWSQVSAGGYHTCAKKTDKTLWCWGGNNYGQLGDGSTVAKNKPARITKATNWASVSTGTFHSCAKKTDKTLWCWGLNGNGQLGDGSALDKKKPVRITRATNWASVSLGAYHTCAKKTDGSVWCWGDNSSGKVGDGTQETRLAPVKVGTDKDWSQIDAGETFSCAKKTNGSLYCWGENTYGQIGDNTLVRKLSPTQENTSALDWSQVSAGQESVCAVKADYSLHCWGYNKDGQIGQSVFGEKNSPGLLGSDTTWKDVAAGYNTSCGIKNNNTLWCAGYNLFGALGNGNRVTSQILVSAGGDTNWASVKVGANHACARKADNKLYCWGAGWSGHLGNGNNNTYDIPQEVSGSASWKGFDTGTEHTCAIKSDDSLWCWGGNSYGQLGDGSTVAESWSPVRESMDTTWSAVSVGINHTCAIKQSDSSIYCWGFNYYGQLGNGSTASSNSPTNVNTDTDWESLAAGGSHNCAIKTDGKLYCWGENSSGQLGDNTNAQKLAPTLVNGDTNWARVQLGNAYTCALKDNGGLYCWGANSSGQLGLGNWSISPRVPAQVGTDTDWSLVAAGNEHTCGKRTGLGIYCWGSNVYGQLGDGNAWYATPQVIVDKSP